jgi:hypothetical protein
MEGFDYFSAEDAESLNVKNSELRELVKSLVADDTGNTDYAQNQGGAALVPQSLEGTLALLTWQDKHLKFQKDIGITKAFSTVEEYTVQDGYGQEEVFVDQLENPDEDDAELFRGTMKVKFLRALWRVGDVLSYTKTITDPYALQIQAATYRLMRGLENALYFGNEEIIPQEIHGLEAELRKNATADHIIDMRGNPLTQTAIKQAIELIAVNFGTPSKMYLSPSMMTGINDILGVPSTQRIIQGNNVNAVRLGNKVTGFDSDFGDFDFVPNIFLNWESRTVPMIRNPANRREMIEGATSAKAPNAPTITAAIVADTTALFTGGVTAPGIRYRVSAINQYGKSIATPATAAVAPTSGDRVDLTITPAGTGNAALGFEIYRETNVGTNKYRLIARIKREATPTTVYQDRNQYIPGTGKSFLCDLTAMGDMRSAVIAQLAPIHKVQYAKTDPSLRGTVNHYVGVKWYAPNKMVQFINVGVGKPQSSPLLDV